MSFIHDKPPRYQSYMLRCWEMRSQDPDRPATWRFSLEDPQTKQRHTFSDWKSMIAFLEAQISEESSTEGLA
jgi:hypothetical protein